MTAKNHLLIQRPNLLRVMLHLRQWECMHQQALQTRSSRDLYLRLAAALLKEVDAPQPLKSLQGAMTERATRECIKDFERRGLIVVLADQCDQRTKHAVPSDSFVLELNQHLEMFMRLCEQEFLMISKK